MCLAMPMKIIEIKNDDKAIVDLSGVKREISIQTLPDKPDIGDYVLIHAGFAIEVLDEQSAKETFQAFDEVDDLLE